MLFRRRSSNLSNDSFKFQLTMEREKKIRNIRLEIVCYALSEILSSMAKFYVEKLIKGNGSAQKMSKAIEAFSISGNLFVPILDFHPDFEDNIKTRKHF